MILFGILSLIVLTDAILWVDWLPILKVLIGGVWLLIPGFCLSYSLCDESNLRWIISVALGLPVSVAMIGIIGIIARTLHLDIQDIHVIWFVLSLLTFIIFIASPHISSKMVKDHFNRQTIAYMVSGISVVAIFAGVSLYTMKKTNDTLLHNADVTYFASGTPLSWGEIYYDSGETISDRNSTTYWILGQGLIVHVSGVHILEAQSHIASLLIIYLGFSIFTGACFFGYSVRDSLLILILHFLVLSLLIADNQPGRIVLRHIIQDKVLAGFGFAPVIFGIIHRIIQLPTWKNYLLFALLLIGAILTHAMMAGFILMVIGVWMLLNSLFTRRLRPYFTILILCGVLFSPILLIRQSTDLEFVTNEATLEENARILLFDDGNTYIANPSAIGELAIGLIVLAGVFGFLSVKKHSIARFHIAVLIVIALGLVPFTASIYGELVGVYKVFRVAWVIPFGMAVFYCLDFAVTRLQKYIAFKSIKPVGIGVLLIAVPFVIGVNSSQLSDYESAIEVDTLNHELIEISEFLENTHTERIIVMGDSQNRFADNLATMSNLIQPMSFCNPRCMVNFARVDFETAEKRLSRNRNFFSERHDNERRLLNLDRYTVDYIVYPKDTGSEYVDPLMAEYSDLFAVVYETEQIQVVEYMPRAE